MAVDAIKNCFNNTSTSISAGCGSFCSGIGSIPKAIQLKLSECSSSDYKIYGLIVLGVLLQVASVLGVAAAIVGAAVLGPLALFGVVPAIATGLLGTYLAISPEDVEDLISPPPYVPGQPVGLKNQENNCWANAGLQLLLNSPRLLNSTQVQSIPELRQAAQVYTAAQQQQHRISQDVDSQVVRDVLKAARAIDMDDPEGQQDPADLFNCLFQGLYQINELRKVTGEESRQDVRREAMIALGLGVGGNAGQDFNTLLRSYFDYENDVGMEFDLKFPTPPNDLLIQLKRFGHQQDPSTHRMVSVKNNEPIPVPPALTLPAERSQDNQVGQYACDGFTVHHGNLLTSGHHIAFIKRPDNTWWWCNDRKVRQVTEQYAHQMMSHGYLYHFSKV